MSGAVFQIPLQIGPRGGVGQTVLSTLIFPENGTWGPDVLVDANKQKTEAQELH